ncbi:unnamed protein product [Cunninghamella blakesleeana]
MTIFANTHFSLAKGLHPRLNTTIYHSINNNDKKDKIELITIPLSPPSPYTISTCALDIIYTLPPSMFVDRYQLRNLYQDIDYFIDDGDANLEKPLEEIPHRDSYIIIRNQATSELITHLRYQQPDHQFTHRIIQLDLPKVGWICYSNPSPHHDQNEKELKMKLSYPTLKESFSFYLNNMNDHHHHHQFKWIPILSSSSSNLNQITNVSSSSLQIHVPVGNLNDVMIVQWGTMITLLFGTLWILWSINTAVKKHRRHEAKGKRRKSE